MKLDMSGRYNISQDFVNWWY